MVWKLGEGVPALLAFSFLGHFSVTNRPRVVSYLSNTFLASQIARSLSNRASLVYEWKATASTGNVDDLPLQLEQIWQEILQETISGLYHSMSHRVVACIQAHQFPHSVIHQAHVDDDWQNIGIETPFVDMLDELCQCVEADWTDVSKEPLSS
ncbi:hypothetical protein TNCV_2279181 [Trichonephila clavipes]|uniref:Uncharacterized protein n=1 Tax=Trichonephila clavipes TaxID=2585209 RepID=A0A8X6R6I0_TRICX|nr:hypothetical protein TNCV_2279181 [Trichonephila clavipes]